MYHIMHVIIRRKPNHRLGLIVWKFIELYTETYYIHPIFKSSIEFMYLLYEAIVSINSPKTCLLLIWLRLFTIWKLFILILCKIYKLLKAITDENHWQTLSSRPWRLSSPATLIAHHRSPIQTKNIHDDRCCEKR